MPSEKVLSGWAAATPQRFKLTLKAPRRITHDSRLRDVSDLLRDFCDLAGTLGEKLGILLFQLPPFFKKDSGLLSEFLEALPRGTRAAIEFRHLSWHSDEIFDRLRARNVALCIADSEKLTTPTVATADYGYLRLRDQGYTHSDIERWAEIIRDYQSVWQDTFVYFKHEEEGKGPEFCKTLQQILSPG
jgi:uncharacterized protein YecE (DUF72 family)